MWYEVLLDALVDTLWLFPFLLLIYILIELMEHNTRVGKPSRALSGRWAPLLGTATGLVPMCGFSVMAAKLWEHRHITVGALVSVFIATSDEAFIVLLLSPLPWAEKGLTLLGLIASKLVLGILVGYLLDLVFSGKRGTAPLPAPHAHDGEHDHDHAHEDHEHGDCACDELSVCEHKKESTLRLYLLSPLLHALEVAAFVLLVNLAFGFLFFGIGGGDSDAGSEAVASFMGGAGYWIQPVVCALVGLIPNCASSVALAEVYALGGIGFGGLLGGLVTNAGLGYLALFGRGKRVKEALVIVAAMFALGVAIGYAAGGIALVI